MARPGVVVVGAGGISGSWFGPLTEEGVDVRAVVDLNIEAAEGRILEYGLDCKPSTDLKGTLKRVRPDLVVDLTVPEAHCEVTCTALRAGCHVIGEKPMAANMSQARRMVKTAEQTGRAYVVSQSRRWDANHQTLHRALAGGRLGRLTIANCDFYLGAHFDGFRVRMASPLILDMAIHHFDLARFLTGTDPVAVYAHEFNPAGSWYEGAAAAACIFEMTDGLVFTYRGSWCSEGCRTGWNGSWRIVGQKGTMLLEDGRPPTGEAVAGKTGGIRKVREIRPKSVELKYPGCHGSLKEMLRFLRTGKIPQTECHDNIKSLAMVLAATESARKGRRVLIREGRGG